jgi:hypothetical protein
MRRAHWSARPHSARAAKIAVPVALALVVGLVLGLKLIGGPGSLSLSAQGACATPSTTVSATPATTASATPSTTGSPTLSAAAPATPSMTTSATPSTTAAAGTTQAVSATRLPLHHRWHYRWHRRWHRPHPTPTPTVVATATTTASATPTTTMMATPCPTASPSATATTPVAVANVNCSIIVPANPLSAAGLATPYQLTGSNGMTPAASGCAMTNAANLGAFVQATILDPATGAIAVYEPLVITQGTTPAVAPVVPTLPANAVVTIDFGFNGTDLTQVGATTGALQQGSCVNGLGAGSDFGQVSFCNGPAFFAAASTAAAAGLLVVPATGTSAKTGQACPTVRSFTMTDQDQSDNVTSVYLLNGNGQTAQDNAANAAALAGATPLVNGSDDKLLTAFLDPTLGCTPFQAPDLSKAGALSDSQALNELSAAKNATAPIGLVPENDEMTLVNGAFSATKTNLYRAQIGQDPISAANDAADSPANYCANLMNIQSVFLNTNQALLATGGTPVAAVGNNLFTFLANRLNMSFTNLNCQNFGLTNPVTVTLDGNGVAIAATLNVTQQTPTATTGTPAPTTAPTTAAPTTPPPTVTPTTAPPTRHRMGRRHHLVQNPSGT